jgi:sodium/potassium/calcium exchanger 6
MAWPPPAEEETCAAASAFARPPALLDYAAVHSCLLRGDARLSLPLLALLLLLHFRFLAAAASARFTPAVSRLAARLRLSPSMAAATLLALGNGAPDAFASAAALGGPAGMPRAGLAAVLSAGGFVSAFAVGAVALVAAPFAVPPAPFSRDVLSYLLAASGLFYIYLTAEIFLWQAVGLVLFYAFFVGLVFYMDSGGGHDGRAAASPAPGLQVVNGVTGRAATTDLPVTVEDHKRQDPALLRTMFSKVCLPTWVIVVKVQYSMFVETRTGCPRQQFQCLPTVCLRCLQIEHGLFICNFHHLVDFAPFFFLEYLRLLIRTLVTGFQCGNQTIILLQATKLSRVCWHDWNE